ncbi:CoA-binding protein [alpha proteobacterium AAP81b]|nr:CoA-binding protein [alpha proteobacterium AAP81b]
MPLTTDIEIAELLNSARTIALVGISDRPDRPSHEVMQTLQHHGYRVIPVNPQITGEHVHGEYVWASLDQIGEPIDIVDIFRNSEAAGEVVDAAIAVGAKAVWMQLGVINAAAAARAEAAGLKVVMNNCPKQEIARLALPPVGEPQPS